MTPAARIAKRIEDGKTFDERAKFAAQEKYPSSSYESLCQYDPPIQDERLLERNAFISGMKHQHTQDQKWKDALEVAVGSIECDYPERPCPELLLKDPDAIECEKCKALSRIADILEGK